MPSSLNYHRELSLQLLFRKTSGKWKKRFVVLRRSLDISQKCYLDIYPHHRPVAKAIRKLGPGSSIEIAISPGSHAVIRDVSEDNKHNLLGLLSLSKSKEPYLFAAHCDGEVKDLDKLADAVEKLCEITSFEVSVDSDSNNSVPSGAAQFHIYKHTACLTSKSPFMKVLQKWQLVEPLAEFKWERHGIHIYNFQEANKDLFMYVKSQEDIQDIQKEMADSCMQLHPCYNTVDTTPIITMMHSSLSSLHSASPIIPMDPPTIENGITYNGTCENHLSVNSTMLQRRSNSMPLTTVEKLRVPTRRRSTSNVPVKETVEIRFPTHPKARRSESYPSIKQSNKEHFNKTLLHENKNRIHELVNFPGILHSVSDNKIYSHLERKENPSIFQQTMKFDNNLNSINGCDKDQSSTDRSDIIREDPSQNYANVKGSKVFRPTFYIYMNVNNPEEAPSTYVNIFSGSSVRSCYENWQHQSSIYSMIGGVKPSDAPPLPPRPSPPKLPPRLQRPVNNHSCATEVPQRPPPLPPKLKSPANSCISVADTCSAPRIQVALFASTPVSGRVWFLRVAFMHQDDKDTTFKRVKDIEAFSNHRLLKSHSLEVLSDVSIQVTVNASTKGFDLLNDNQQNIELNDIENLRKGDWFIIEFHIQNSDDTNDQFIGNVSIGPTATMTCRRTCRADMGINEVFQRKVINQIPSDTQTRQLLLADYNRRQKLCRQLDITINSQSHDWRQVAGSLGFTHAEIIELQDKACRSVTFSPTDEVLKMWEQREPNCTMEKLVNILREIGRLDIVQDLGYSITLES